MTGMNNLILNMIIVLLPFILIKWFGESRYKIWEEPRNHIYIGILCSLSIMLCMSFPFSVLPGYIFDLRTVPLLVGILYGGYTGGLLSALTLYLFRFYIGGEGVWNVWIVYSIVIVLAFLMVPTYQEMSPMKKILTTTGLSLWTSLLMVINTFFREGFQQAEWSSVFLYFLLHGFTTWICFYMIEQGKADTSEAWDWSNPFSKPERLV